MKSAELKRPPGAVAFEPNEWFEARLGERTADPARFAFRYSTATQRAVEAYARAKAFALSAPARGGDGRR